MDSFVSEEYVLKQPPRSGSALLQLPAVMSMMCVDMIRVTRSMLMHTYASLVGL